MILFRHCPSRDRPCLRVVPVVRASESQAARFSAVRSSLGRPVHDFPAVVLANHMTGMAFLVRPLTDDELDPSPGATFQI
jgi:hypothetical protein